MTKPDLIDEFIREREASGCDPETITRVRAHMEKLKTLAEKHVLPIEALLEIQDAVFDFILSEDDLDEDLRKDNLDVVFRNIKDEHGIPDEEMNEVVYDYLDIVGKKMLQ